MKVDVGRNCTNFGSESGNLVCKHAGSWGLDRVIPIVVVVAQSVSKVQDCHLADVRRVFSDIEVCRLDTALCH